MLSPNHGNQLSIKTFLESIVQKFPQLIIAPAIIAIPGQTKLDSEDTVL